VCEFEGPSQKLFQCKHSVNVVCSRRAVHQLALCALKTDKGGIDRGSVFPCAGQKRKFRELTSSEGEISDGPFRGLWLHTEHCAMHVNHKKTPRGSPWQQSPEDRAIDMKSDFFLPEPMHLCV